MNFKYFIYILSFTVIASCKVSQEAKNQDGASRTPMTQSRSLKAEEANSDTKTANMAAKQEMPLATDCIDSKAIMSSALRCPPTKAEVCGCNGVTYNNSCEADKAGVTKYSTGPCKSNVKSTGNSGQTATK